MDLRPQVSDALVKAEAARRREEAARAKHERKLARLRAGFDSSESSSSDDEEGLAVTRQQVKAGLVSSTPAAVQQPATKTVATSSGGTLVGLPAPAAAAGVAMQARGVSAGSGSSAAAEDPGVATGAKRTMFVSTGDMEPASQEPFPPQRPPATTRSTFVGASTLDSESDSGSEDEAHPPSRPTGGATAVSRVGGAAKPQAVQQQPKPPQGPSAPTGRPQGAAARAAGAATDTAAAATTTAAAMAFAAMDTEEDDLLPTYGAPDGAPGTTEKGATKVRAGMRIPLPKGKPTEVLKPAMVDSGTSATPPGSPKGSGGGLSQPAPATSTQKAGVPEAAAAKAAAPAPAIRPAATATAASQATPTAQPPKSEAAKAPGTAGAGAAKEPIPAATTAKAPISEAKAPRSSLKVVTSAQTMTSASATAAAQKTTPTAASPPASAAAAARPASATTAPLLPTHLTLPKLPAWVPPSACFTITLTSPDGLSTQTAATLLHWLLSQQAGCAPHRSPNQPTPPGTIHAPFTVVSLMLVHVPPNHPLLRDVASVTKSSGAQQGKQGAGKGATDGYVRALLAACIPNDLHPDRALAADPTDDDGCGKAMRAVHAAVGTITWGHLMATSAKTASQGVTSPRGGNSSGNTTAALPFAMGGQGCQQMQAAANAALGPWIGLSEGADVISPAFTSKAPAYTTIAGGVGPQATTASPLSPTGSALATSPTGAQQQGGAGSTPQVCSRLLLCSLFALLRCCSFLLLSFLVRLDPPLVRSSLLWRLLSSLCGWGYEHGDRQAVEGPPCN